MAGNREKNTKGYGRGIIMKKKSITSNYIYNLVYQFLILVVPFITTPYLTRVLGDQNLGIYSYTYSIITIFFLIGMLGINTYGQREIAYEQENSKEMSKIFWELVITRFISTLFSLVLLLIFIISVKRYSLFLGIFSLYVVANFFDISWLYQGIENFKGVAIRNIVVKVIYFISIFLFVKSKDDLWVYILLYSLSTMLANLSFWIGINKIIRIKNIGKLNIKRHFKSIFVFFVPQVASLIYSVLDKTMIGIIIPNISYVFYYEQASYIVKTTLTLITTIGTVMISRMSCAYKSKNMTELQKYFYSVINFVWLFGCALLFGICAVVKNFVPWFYGNNFTDITSLVYILSPLILIIGLNNVIGIQYLIPTKQQNKYVFAVIIGAFINFILNLILLKTIGTNGAAIASVLAELSILIIEIIYIREQLNITKIFKFGIKYLILGFVMFISSYFVGTVLNGGIIVTLVQIIVGIVIYMSLLFITKDDFLHNICLNFKRKR